jgi:hypothetical protein
MMTMLGVVFEWHRGVPGCYGVPPCTDRALAGNRSRSVQQRHRRAIPHKLENCGYVPVRNPDRDTGLWVVADKRQVVYAKADLSERERMAAVRRLVAGKQQSWQAV